MHLRLAIALVVPRDQQLHSTGLMLPCGLICPLNRLTGRREIASHFACHLVSVCSLLHRTECRIDANLILAEFLNGSLK